MASKKLLAALAVLAVAFVVLAAVPAVATDSDAASVTSDKGHDVGDTGVKAYFSVNNGMVTNTNMDASVYTDVVYDSSKGVYKVVGVVGAIGGENSGFKVFTGGENGASVTNKSLGFKSTAALNGVILLDFGKLIEKKTGNIELEYSYTVYELTKGDGTENKTSTITTPVDEITDGAYWALPIPNDGSALTMAITVDGKKTEMKFDFSETSTVIDLGNLGVADGTIVGGTEGSPSVKYTAPTSGNVGTLVLEGYEGNLSFYSYYGLNVTFSGENVLTSYGKDDTGEGDGSYAIRTLGKLTITSAKSGSSLTVVSKHGGFGIAGAVTVIGSDAKGAAETAVSVTGGYTAVYTQGLTIQNADMEAHGTEKSIRSSGSMAVTGSELDATLLEGAATNGAGQDDLQSIKVKADSANLTISGGSIVVADTVYVSGKLTIGTEAAATAGDEGSSVSTDNSSLTVTAYPAAVGGVVICAPATLKIGDETQKDPVTSADKVKEQETAVVAIDADNVDLSEIELNEKTKTLVILGGTVTGSIDVPEGGITVCGATSFTATVRNGDDSAVLEGLKGDFTITQGSVAITGQDLSGTISGVTGTIDVTGTVGDNLSVTGNSGSDAVLDVTVESGKTLTLTGVTASGAVVLNGSSSKLIIGGHTYSTDMDTTTLALADNVVTLTLEVGKTLTVDSNTYKVTATAGKTGSAVEITLSEGKIAGDMEIPADTVLTVANGKILGGNKVTVAKGGQLTLTAGDLVIDEKARLIVAGTVQIASSDAEIVNEGSVIITDAGALLTTDGKNFNASISGDGTVDVSAIQAEGTLQTGDIVSTTDVRFYQHYTATANATFKEGADLTVEGQLVINEGVTITIEEGSQIIVTGGQASIVNNGTIVLNGYSGSADQGVLSSKAYGSIVNNGTITASADSVGTGHVIYLTGKLENAGTVTVGEYSDIYLANGADVRNTGSISIAGTVGATSTSGETYSVANSGSIALNGSLSSDLAVTNETADATVALTGVSATAAQKITVTSGIEKVGSTKVSNSGKVEVSITAGTTVSGLTIGAATKDITASGAASKSYASVSVLGGTLAGALTSGASDTSATVYMAVAATGYASVPDALTVGLHTSVSLENADIVGAVVVADNAALTFNKEVTVSGSVTVNNGTSSTGKLNLASGSTTTVSGTITSSYAGAVIPTATATLKVTGKVTVVSAALTGISYSGAMYKVAKDPAVSGSVDKYVYTSLATAVSDGATDITLFGEFTVSDDVTVASGTTVSTDDNAEVTVKEGKILEFATGSTLKNAGKIQADGALIIDATKASLKGAGTIVSVVVLTDGDKTTYSGLAYALGIAADGSTVKVSDEYTGDIAVASALTIPAGVTLDTNDHAITVSKNVILTVDGTLFLDGSKSVLTLTQLTSSDASTDKAASVVLNGVIKSDKSLSAYTALISGAYYQVEENTTTYNYVSTVAYAAGISTTIYNGVMDVYGEQTLADVAFAGTSSQALTVTFHDKVTASVVSLSYATVKIDSGKAFSGVVSDAVGSVTINGTAGSGFSIADTVPSAGQLLTVSGSLVLTDSNSKVTGTFTVQNNVVLRGFSVEKAVVDGVATVKGTAAIDDLTVNGTVAVDNAAVLTVKKAEVQGTMSAADAVTGTSPKAAGEIRINGQLFVGITDEAVDSANLPPVSGDAVVSGAVSLVGSSYAVVAAGSSVPDAWNAATSTLKKTVYNVDGAEYVAVYASFSTLPITVIAHPEIENAVVTDWKNADDKKASESNPSVGAPDWTVVDAVVKTDIFEVTIITDGSVSSITLNGIIVPPSSSSTADTFESTPIRAGSYTIAFSPAAGYDVTGLKLTAADGTPVSGFEIVVNDDTTENWKVTYQLIGGKVASSSSSGGLTSDDIQGIIDAIDKNTEATENIKVEGGSSKDSSLTDILLIVLVVLIVIMAILVAMRMMRS